MSRFVYSLSETPDEPALVGGKGAALGWLARSGLPVPAGFVLTADAFRAFLDANGLDGGLAAAAEDEVISRLRAASWPDGLRAEIESAYEALREGAASVRPVAVRSSATAEDSGAASFAGQHATHLNVTDLDGVFESVLACWASLYRAQALHYREARRVEDAGPAMAVVVQTLVPADASGVAFTLDPVSGDRDVVVLEAAFGLGEGVVSGAVTPDHLAVRKSDGAIVRREVATKRLRVTADAAGGTHDEELSPERANAPSLSDDQAVELARLAAGIAERAGAPQDIEWALADGRFFLLQSRPITAAGADAPAQQDDEGWVSEFDTDTDPATIWTAANVQEVLPDQLSPFSLSVNNDIVEQFGAQPVERMGVRLQNQDPFFAFFYGRPFLNVSLMLEVTEQTPFGSTDALMDQFLAIKRDDEDALKDIDLSVVPKLSLPARILRYASVTPRALWLSWRMPAEIRRAEQTIAEFEAEDAARPFSAQSDEELLQTFDDGLRRGAEVSITHVSGGGITSSSFEWLRSCTEAWLGDENGVLQAKLCTGLAGLESAQPAYELWELSRLVLASEDLREAFETADGTEIERRVSSVRGIDGSNFRRGLDEFLSRHGHRSVMEAEASAKSWDEDLPTVFAMVRNYLHADPAASPQRVEERQRRQREAATAEALRELSPWKRPIFRYVLRQAQEWVVSREHTKSLLVRVTHRGRRLTRELARRMVDRGLLDDLWDLYWLTQDEVKSFLSGELTRDEAYARIGRRKAEHARNRAVTLPETFQGRPKLLRPEDQPLPDGHTLHGIAVSPGRVTGRARVILDPRRDATIEPGEILVAPVTDAGWTPLFVAAAGVVVDIGGTLSHGSTVAREYGLPAVVNVKHGTRMIQTGQTITVDGTQGVVVLDSDEQSRTEPPTNV